MVIRCVALTLGLTNPQGVLRSELSNCSSATTFQGVSTDKCDPSGACCRRPVSVLSASRSLHDDLVERELRVALKMLAPRIPFVEGQIADIEARLRPIIAEQFPALLGLHGVGPHSAAQLLIAAGDNADRLHSDAAFAKLCGAAHSRRRQARRFDSDWIAVAVESPTGRCIGSGSCACATTRQRAVRCSTGRGRQVEVRDHRLPRTIRRNESLRCDPEPARRDSNRHRHSPTPNRRRGHAHQLAIAIGSRRPTCRGSNAASEQNTNRTLLALDRLTDRNCAVVNGCDDGLWSARAVCWWGRTERWKSTSRSWSVNGHSRTARPVGRGSMICPTSSPGSLSDGDSSCERPSTVAPPPTSSRRSMLAGTRAS